VYSLNNNHSEVFQTSNEGSFLKPIKEYTPDYKSNNSNNKDL